MLDLKFIRENSELVRKNLEKRKQPEYLDILDKILKLDREWRSYKPKVQELQYRRNQVSADIAKLKKAGKSADALMKEAREIPEKIKDMETKEAKMKEQITALQLRLPNMLHDSVPYGREAKDNAVVKEWGEKIKPDFELKPHGELAEELGIADFRRAAKVSGNGFAFIKGDLAMLDLALQRFAIDFLAAKGFVPIEVPHLLRKEPYEGVTDIEEFKTMMYWVKEADAYLIATSEHPIAAMYQNEVLEEKELPIKYAGISSCYRKEIGSHSVDTKGLFRMHQFSKVEMFVFCKPEESWKIHEELLKNLEEIYQKLKLPYRVVNICTGDIGIVAAKKYDLELWFPREGHMEAASCSNCTAYQATRLNTRFTDGKTRQPLHTLNSTAIATSRTMRAILEVCQQKDGTVKIPDVLQPYMNGKKKIQ